MPPLGGVSAAGRSTTTTTTCTRRIATTTTRRTRTTTSGFASPKPLNAEVGRVEDRPDLRGWIKLTQPCRAQGLPDRPACPRSARAGKEKGPAVVSSRKAKGAAGPPSFHGRDFPEHCIRLTCYDRGKVNASRRLLVHDAAPFGAIDFPDSTVHAAASIESAPSLTPTRTVAPSAMFPAISSRPTRVSSSRCRNRFSGLAPNTGS